MWLNFKKDNFLQMKSNMREDKKEKFIKTKEIWKNQHKK